LGTKREINMDNKFTAVIKKENGWWIGWIEEVPGVNCQERTKEELLLNLKETLKEAIEFNKKDALRSAGKSYQEEKIAL
jgi:predicted RNase H-like HicB family nuclease